MTAPLVGTPNGESSRAATKMAQSWMPSEGGIATYHTFVPPPLPTAPSFHLHLTRMRDTLFIWVGTGSEGSEDEESTGSVGGKRLAGDWAVAMPTRGVSTPSNQHHYCHYLLVHDRTLIRDVEYSSDGNTIIHFRSLGPITSNVPTTGYVPSFSTRSSTGRVANARPSKEIPT